MIPSGVRKERPTDCISGGKYSLVGRAQARIDRDASLIVADPSRFEIETIDCRTPSRGDEQMRSQDLPRISGDSELDAYACRGILDGRDLCLLDEPDALVVETAPDDIDGLGMIPT